MSTSEMNAASMTPITAFTIFIHFWQTSLLFLRLDAHLAILFKIKTTVQTYGKDIKYCRSAELFGMLNNELQGEEIEVLVGITEGDVVAYQYVPRILCFKSLYLFHSSILYTTLWGENNVRHNEAWPLLGTEGYWYLRTSEGLQYIQ